MNVKKLKDLTAESAAGAGTFVCTFKSKKATVTNRYDSIKKYTIHIIIQ